MARPRKPTDVEAPVGRPKVKIDVEQLERIAERQWTPQEIAAFFRVHYSLINRRFGRIIDEASLRGKAKLRDMQLKRAMEGSDRMLVHLGTVYLGQTYRAEVKVESVGETERVRVIESLRAELKALVEEAQSYQVPLLIEGTTVQKT